MKGEPSLIYLGFESALPAPRRGTPDIFGPWLEKDKKDSNGAFPSCHLETANFKLQ
jgi:hypothetical protein